MIHPADGEELLNTGQAAVMMGVTPATIGNWSKAGRLTGIRIGGRKFFRKLALLALISEPQSRPAIVDIHDEPEITANLRRPGYAV